MGAGQLDLHRRRTGRPHHRPAPSRAGRYSGHRISHQTGRLSHRADQRPHQHVWLHLQRRWRPDRDLHRHARHPGRAVAVALSRAQPGRRGECLTPQRRKLQHLVPCQPAAPVAHQARGRSRLRQILQRSLRYGRVDPQRLLHLRLLAARLPGLRPAGAARPNPRLRPGTKPRPPRSP